MPPKEKYTDPDLRDEIKEEIKAGDKGGKPGQWSARKAQFMASEYKKRGGGYNEPKDASQRHLSEWTEEHWQTKEGSGNARREDGSEKRYLPKKAWDNMTESEKEETERLKIEGGKEGKQYVENTDTAKSARVGASVHEQEDGDGEGEKEEVKKDKGHARQAYKGKGAEEKQDGGDDEQVGQKRSLRSSSTKGAGAEASTNSPATNKKQKVNDTSPNKQKSSPSKSSSKSSSTPKKTTSTTPPKPNSHARKTSTSSTKNNTTTSTKDNTATPAPAGSTTRLPKKGQSVRWKSGSSYTEGEVVEIVTEEKEVEGVKVKGSQGDPRVVVRSSKSGKVAAHKGEACYFEDV